VRKSVMSTAATAVFLMLSASAAIGGPPGTFSLTEYGRAVTAGDASIAVPAGEAVAVETLDPRAAFERGLDRFASRKARPRYGGDGGGLHALHR
jgi:hypothetical protein